MSKKLVTDQAAQRADLMPDSLGATYAMDRLSNAFENSARRWELIVYPTLFAFIILAAYGFFLIFSLAKDIHFLANSVDSNMNAMVSNFQAVSKNMERVTANMHDISQTLDNVSGKMDTLEPIRSNMEDMNRSMTAITLVTHNLQTDMALMNRSVHNVSRPMSFMNTFMPW
jgi:hypothetical protein